MKGLILVITTALVLSGCGAGKFAVKTADTRFSENKNPVYLSENNRISTKSIAGGFHIDDKGVFVNPFVAKDADTGEVTVLGFNVLNKTSYDTIMGGPNQLGVIQEVVFRLENGEIITLDVINQENRTSDTILYNSVSRSAGYDKWESGMVTISKADFAKLASASSISAKISGTKQSAIYETGDVSAAFLANIKQFYENYVK